MARTRQKRFYDIGTEGWETTHASEHEIFSKHYPTLFHKLIMMQEQVKPREITVYKTRLTVLGYPPIRVSGIYRFIIS